MYSPKSNGQIERVNRFIKDGIQLALASRLPVRKFIQERVFAYNTTPNSVTGLTPFFLMRGRQCVNELFPKVADNEDGLSAIVAVDDDKLHVRKKIVECQLKSKSYHDKTHRALHKHFSIGDWALVTKPNTQLKGESKYFDPEQVIEVSEGAICLKNAGWRNKSDAIKLKQVQVELWYKGEVNKEGNGDVFSWLILMVVTIAQRLLTI